MKNGLPNLHFFENLYIYAFFFVYSYTSIYIYEYTRKKAFSGGYDLGTDFRIIHGEENEKT
jgi:hypothetical protein